MRARDEQEFVEFATATADRLFRRTVRPPAVACPFSGAKRG